MTEKKPADLVVGTRYVRNGVGPHFALEEGEVFTLIAKFPIMLKSSLTMKPWVTTIKRLDEEFEEE